MYLNISFSKKVLKKIIKYLILFIIGCIAIFYTNTLNVNAADTTFSVNSLDITFPQYIHWYDNVSGNLSSKSTYNYLTAFTSSEDYLYLSQPSTSLLSTSNSGGFTLFYSLPVIEGHSYLLYNYFINSSKSAYFSHTLVNSSYRYFQSCTNTSLSSCTNVTSTGAGYLGFTEYGNTYITSSFNKFTATKTDHYINISIGTTSTITIPSGNPTIGFIGYRLIDITTYSDETIQGMIQDNQTSLDNLEEDVAILQETQQATNDKLDDQIQQDKEQHDEIMDSNTSGATDDATSFFDDFSNTDHGGISGVVSAPLELIKSLINNNNVCSNLNFSVFEKDVYFPSGCVLWNKVPDSFITIWNVLICGLGSYGILIALFKDIEKLKTPDSKGVDTLDL